MFKITAKDEGAGSCPLCREAVGSAATKCPECETGYHSDCLLEFGGTCVTLGCRKTLPGFEAAPLDLSPPSDHGDPSTGRAPAPETSPDGDPPDLQPAGVPQARPWRWPPAGVWIVTGLIWLLPTTIYRLSTSVAFFDLAFWTEVLVLAVPVWIAASFVTPMVLNLPRRW